MFALGLPVGLQFLAEVGVFSAVQVIMGGLGTTAVAAHQVAIMLASLTFSVCVGVGAATSVQVGRAVGATVGDVVGVAVGALDGLCVGRGVGVLVGAGDGAGVGDADGAEVTMAQ